MSNKHYVTEEARKNNYNYRLQYTKKTYKRIAVQLRKSEDSDIIEWLEEKVRNGESYSGIANKALRNYFEKRNPHY